MLGKVKDLELTAGTLCVLLFSVSKVLICSKIILILPFLFFLQEEV